MGKSEKAAFALPFCILAASITTRLSWRVRLMGLRGFVRMICLMAPLATIAGCAVNPVTGTAEMVLMSEADELELGQQGDAEIRRTYGVYDDHALTGYVADVGRRIVLRSHRTDLAYRFTILDTPMVNAFAMPGGYIYVTRGMLAYLNSEAELAALLAHEIGHVTARHTVRQESSSAIAQIGFAVGSVLMPGLGALGSQGAADVVGTAMMRGYGREQELEADRLGAQYLARAGYDPKAMLRLLTVLKSHETAEKTRAGKEGAIAQVYHGLFATHPDNDTRLKQVVGETDGPSGPRAADPYLQYIDGLAYGRSGAMRSLVRGSTLYHGPYDFMARFPDGWRIQGQTDKVLARSPDGDAWIELMVYQGVPAKPQQALAALMDLPAGAPVATRAASGDNAAKANAVDRRGWAVQFASTLVVMIHGGVSAEARARHRSAVDAAFDSVRPLSAEERRLARPSVRVVKAEAGETYAALADRSLAGEHLLRLLNNASPDDQPQAGRLVKIID